MEEAGEEAGENAKAAVGKQGAFAAGIKQRAAGNANQRGPR